MPIQSNINQEELNKQILAILFLYNEPIKISKILEYLNNQEFDIEIIYNSFNSLSESLEKVGLTLVESSSKRPEDKEFKLVLKSDYQEIAKRIKQDELEGNLTPAALQVLTICAYLGASSKNEISFIRGVQSTQSIRSLMTRGLLKKIGDKYVLSIDVLQNLGIKKIEDLPEYESIKKDFKERLQDIMLNEKVEDNNTN